MTNSSEYTPSKVWTWNYPNSGRFATINRPIAGPTHDKELPVGRHPLQLYSLGTPNGVKITIFLDELLAIGQSGADNAPRALKFYVFGQGHGGGESFRLARVNFGISNDRLDPCKTHSKSDPISREIMRDDLPAFQINNPSLREQGALH